MPRHNFDPLRGQLTTLEIASEAAADNQLGDPGRRACAVYLPPGYAEGDDSYPLLVALAAYTGSGLKLANWNSFDETLPQRVDRLIAAGEKIGPSTAAFFQVVIEARPHPEQGFRTCLGILSLARSYDNARVDAACRRGILIKARSVASMFLIL